MGAAGGVAGFNKVWLAVAGLLLASTAGAQLAADARTLDWRSPSSSLGLSPARAEVAIGCGSSLLPCNSPDQALAATRVQDSLHWSVEMGVLNLGSTGMAVSPVRQGLNLSLVGRHPLPLFGSRFSVYGKLGTTYGIADPSLAAATPPAGVDGGYGLSFGAGVSMDFTKRLSGSFGFDSHELRLGGGPRDPVRSTSLGLQYRY